MNGFVGFILLKKNALYTDNTSHCTDLQCYIDDRNPRKSVCSVFTFDALTRGFQSLYRNTIWESDNTTNRLNKLAK